MTVRGGQGHSQRLGSERQRLAAGKIGELGAERRRSRLAHALVSLRSVGTGRPQRPARPGERHESLPPGNVADVSGRPLRLGRARGVAVGRRDGDLPLRARACVAAAARPPMLLGSERDPWGGQRVLHQRQTNRLREIWTFAREMCLPTVVRDRRGATLVRLRVLSGWLHSASSSTQQGRERPYPTIARASLH